MKAAISKMTSLSWILNFFFFYFGKLYGISKFSNQFFFKRLTSKIRYRNCKVIKVCDTFVMHSSKQNCWQIILQFGGTPTWPFNNHTIIQV